MLFDFWIKSTMIAMAIAKYLKNFAVIRTALASSGTDRVKSWLTLTWRLFALCLTNPQRTDQDQ